MFHFPPSELLEFDDGDLRFWFDQVTRVLRETPPDA